MNLLKKNLLKVLFTSYSVFLPLISQATDVDGHPCDPTKQLCNPININSLNGFIKAILEGALRIGIPIVALAIIYSGFLFVAARGNSEKITKAKDALLYSLIGAAILLGSWAIAQLVTETILAL